MRATKKPASAPPLSKLLRAARKAAGQPRKHFFDLARALAALHEGEPENFAAMTSAGIGSRRLYYLRDVGAFIGRCGIDKTKAECLGWTRLLAVAQHAQTHPEATPAEIAAWLGLAQRLTAHELPSALGTDNPPDTKDRALLLRLAPGDYEVVEAALLAHGAYRRGKGLVGKEAALVAMAMVTAS